MFCEENHEAIDFGVYLFFRQTQMSSDVKWSKVGDFKSDGWSCKMAVNNCKPCHWRWMTVVILGVEWAGYKLHPHHCFPGRRTRRLFNMDSNVEQSLGTMRTSLESGTWWVTLSISPQKNIEFGHPGSSFTRSFSVQDTSWRLPVAVSGLLSDKVRLGLRREHMRITGENPPPLAHHEICP